MDTETTPICRHPTCRTTITPGYADRGLCAAHERRALTAIGDIPDLYPQLLPLIREKAATGIGTTGGKFGPSVPLNVGVDALVRNIGWTTATWAEIVRDRRGLSDRIGTIKDRCHTLTAHWNVLMAIRDWPIVTYEGRTVTTVDGADGIIDLIRLHDHADRLIGQTAQIINIPGICSTCGHPDLRHRDGEETLWCGHCWTVTAWNTYGLYVDILAGDVVDRLTGTPLV